MIHFARNSGMLQERLDLRCEDEKVFSGVVVHGFDAKAVSNQEKTFLPAVPNCECEHAAKVFHALDAVLLVGVDNGFRVGAGSELVAARDQIRRKIGEVVDFAVKDNHNGAVFIENRLLAAAESDNAQAAMPQADVGLDEVT